MNKASTKLLGLMPVNPRRPVKSIIINGTEHVLIYVGLTDTRDEVQFIDLMDAFGVQRCSISRWKEFLDRT